MKVNRRQLLKKFKHASDFGVAGTATNANLAAFEAALEKHVVSGDAVHIDGSYRGQSAILHVDPNDSLVVITDRAANFISGWRWRAQQLEYALRDGKLGGG